MPGPLVRVDTVRSAQIVTIDRPEALNALNHVVILDLVAALERANRAPGSAIVLTGAGEKAFCAGADIAEMATMDPSAAAEHARLGHGLADAIAASPKVTIAAVNGYALGGGCEMALACDLRVASENAQFGLPEVGLAVIPGFGGTQRLPRIVGEPRAKQMILTGERIKADTALSWGLVNAVVPREKLLEEALRIADAISVHGPRAVALARESITRGMSMTLAEGLAFEQKAFALCFATRDQKEGMKAFLEKRKPSYEGR